MLFHAVVTVMFPSHAKVLRLLLEILPRARFCMKISVYSIKTKFKVKITFFLHQLEIRVFKHSKTQLVITGTATLKRMAEPLVGCGLQAGLLKPVSSDLWATVLTCVGKPSWKQNFSGHTSISRASSSNTREIYFSPSSVLTSL